MWVLGGFKEVMIVELALASIVYFCYGGFHKSSSFSFVSGVMSTGDLFFPLLVSGDLNFIYTTAFT